MIIKAFVLISILCQLRISFRVHPFSKNALNVQLNVASTNTDISNRKNSEVFIDEINLSQQTAPHSSKPLKPLKFYKPEVLAPAGGWEQLKAAAANGADAVYFGLQEGFNARARASNFAVDELNEVMMYLHDRGMKGYLVVNILVFDSEMIQFRKIVEKVANAGVDALIMQDIGAVNYIRKLAPNLPIHGSTQMSITDSYGSLFAGRLGIDRVVVGRELSINDIHSVSKNSNNIEVEAFVHGALCVSYSGQCFSSEAWGGRSANRGQCAQACRMPYGLIVNGSLTELYQDVQYLLSPQDLMAVDYVPQLIQAGVRSFKIEGRLKGPEYVAITTRAYRHAIDEAWATLQIQQQQQEDDEEEEQQQLNGIDNGSKNNDNNDNIMLKALPSFKGPNDSLRRDLLQVFSRGQDEEFNGLSAGFLTGVKHQSLVRGNSPRHRGVYLGKVMEVSTKGILVNLAGTGAVKRGDGIVFDRGVPEEKEEGGSVYEVFLKSKSVPKNEEISQGPVLLTFGRYALEMHRISVGDLVWKNKDPALDIRLKEFVSQSAENTLALVPVKMKITGKLNKPLHIQITVANTDESSPSNDQHDSESFVSVGYGQTTNVLCPAIKSPMTKQDLLKSIGKLGGTPFSILNEDDDIDLSDLILTEHSFIPAAEIKAARRDAVEDLINKRRQHSKNKNFNTDSSLLQTMRSEASIIASSPVITSVQSNRQSKPLSVDHHNHPIAAETTSINDSSLSSSSTTTTTINHTNNIISITASSPSITVLCRTPLQVMAACEIEWLDEIILDFLEVHGIREAVKMVQKKNKKAIVATPRIIKPDENKLVNFYLRLKPDALLVRSAGLLEQILILGGPGNFSSIVNTTIPPLYGDFSLNIANALTASTFLSHGLSRITPTHDLNAMQIIQLANILDDDDDDDGNEGKGEAKRNNNNTIHTIKNSRLHNNHNLTQNEKHPTSTSTTASRIESSLPSLQSLPPPPQQQQQHKGSSKIECIIHNHMPIFHTEYCVFCRFLSTGNNYRDCGHPCETNHVALRSMEGEDHLVLADQGCRNTVFNAKAQTGAEYLPQFIQAGIQRFRVELVDESPEYVEPLLQWYKTMLTPPSLSSTAAATATSVIATGSVNSDNSNIDLHGTKKGSSKFNSSNNNNNMNNNNNSNKNSAAKSYTRSSSTSTSFCTSESISTNQRLQSFYHWLETVPNGNGRAQGYTLGSLKPSVERDWDSMKRTADQ